MLIQQALQVQKTAMAQAKEAFPGTEMAVQTDPPGRHSPSADPASSNSRDLQQEEALHCQPERDGSLRYITQQQEPNAGPVGYAGATLRFLLPLQAAQG